MSSTPPSSPPSGTCTPDSPKRKREEEIDETEQPPTKVAKTETTTTIDDPQSPEREQEIEETDDLRSLFEESEDEAEPAKPQSPKRKLEIEDEDDSRSLFGESEGEAEAKKTEEPAAKKVKTTSAIPDSERPNWWVSDDEDEVERAKAKRQKRMKARAQVYKKKSKPAPLPEWYGRSEDEDDDEDYLEKARRAYASEGEDESEVEVEDEDEDEDDDYEDPNRLRLYDNGDGRAHYKKNQVATGHINFFENGHKAITAPRRTYQQQGDPDAFEHDSDYEDTDYDYARDPDDDDDRKKAVDPEEYDSDFETKEISSGGKIKLPDYKEKDKENEEITVEKDEAKKAWKMLNGVRAEEVVEALATEEYVEWKKQCEEFFTTDVKQMMEMFEEGPDFPKIESEECGFGFRDCVKGEKLGICQHDVLRVLKGSGVLIEGDDWVERLKKERMRWHPDRFARKMQGLYEDEAKEMFQMIQVLVEKEEREL